MAPESELGELPAAEGAWGMFLARAVHAMYHEGATPAEAGERIAVACAAHAGRPLETMSRPRRRLVRALARRQVSLAWGPDNCKPEICYWAGSP